MSMFEGITDLSSTLRAVEKGANRYAIQELTDNSWRHIAIVRVLRPSKDEAKLRAQILWEFRQLDDDDSEDRV